MKSEPSSQPNRSSNGHSKSRSLSKHAFRVECKVLGLGWIVFAFARSMAAAMIGAERARFIVGRWPGKTPRQVRIVEKQDRHGRTRADGECLLIHKLNGVKYEWPAHWSGRRDPKDAAMLELTGGYVPPGSES